MNKKIICKINHIIYYDVYSVKLPLTIKDMDILTIKSLAIDGINFELNNKEYRYSLDDPFTYMKDNFYNDSEIRDMKIDNILEL